MEFARCDRAYRVVIDDCGLGGWNACMEVSLELVDIRTRKLPLGAGPFQLSTTGQLQLAVN